MHECTKSVHALGKSQTPAALCAFVHSCTRAFHASSDGLASILLAPCCASCNQLLEHPTQGPVCEACWESIRPLTPPLCDGCGTPLPAWRVVSIPLGRCPRCRRLESYVDRARAIGTFDGSLRAIIHAFKYEGRRSLAKRLGGMMRVRGADMLDGAAWAVPVPLHPSRRRQRGFNQAADLARNLGLPVRRALCRRRATSTQTGLSAAQRRRNVRDAFGLGDGWLRRWSRWGGRERLRGSIVVLVDDVSTTGATLEACARVLKEVAGAREVRALTAARAVPVRR
jgi:ComF family protein